MRKAYEDFDFGLVNSTLFNFCTNDLSAFYFDIRKDALYCDPRVRARADGPTRTVTDEIFRRIVTWFAPILCFTMEEAWVTRFPERQRASERLLRHAGGLEQSRSDREMVAHPRSAPGGDGRAGTGARRQDISVPRSKPHPCWSSTDAADKALFDTIDLAEVAITSTATVEVCVRSRRPLCHSRNQGRGRQIRQSRWRKMRPLLARAGGSDAPSRYPPLRPLHRCGRRPGAGMTVPAHNGLEPREVGLVAAALRAGGRPGLQAVHALRRGLCSHAARAIGAGIAVF